MSASAVVPGRYVADMLNSIIGLANIMTTGLLGWRWHAGVGTALAAVGLLLNPGWQGGSWVSENSLPIAIGWSLLLTAIFGRKYRRLSP